MAEDKHEQQEQRRSQQVAPSGEPVAHRQVMSGGRLTLHDAVSDEIMQIRQAAGSIAEIIEPVTTTRAQRTN